MSCFVFVEKTNIPMNGVNYVDSSLSPCFTFIIYFIILLRPTYICIYLWVDVTNLLTAARQKQNEKNEKRMIVSKICSYRKLILSEYIHTYIYPVRKRVGSFSVQAIIFSFPVRNLRNQFRLRGYLIFFLFSYILLHMYIVPVLFNFPKQK